MRPSPFQSILLEEIRASLAQVSATEAEELVRSILVADAIFLAGAGRSGLMGKAFAMRLMHLGLRAYVVGETVTAGITSRGLLLLCSGSGETKGLVAMAEKAKAFGAKVALVTIVPDSTLGRLADVTLRIPAATKEGSEGGLSTVQPMGSLFEQSLLLVLDAIVLQLMDQLQIQSDSMFLHHANLE